LKADFYQEKAYIGFVDVLLSKPNENKMDKKTSMPPAKTRLELADEMGVSYTTLYRWLKKNQIELASGLVPPQKIIEIYETLGFPVPEEYQMEG
jgi:hypothetical protein